MATLASTSTIDPAVLNAFAGTLQGGLFQPGDAEYDDARRIFNAMIDRRPAMVVRPVNTEDIRRSVDFARVHDLPVSVKGGGHNVAGSAVGPGALMLDCSGMKGVSVDPERRVAVAEAGLLLADLDRATQEHGLATPLGVVSVTGIAGLTLGGGIGWLNGKHGLAVDNVLAAEIVTADGELRTVNAEQHPDLYWAIRGGGGNFGVVTSLTYQLHPLGPVLAGGVSFPPERTREALLAYSDFSATCPDDLSLTTAIEPDEQGRLCFRISFCWIGPHDGIEPALKPLRDLGASDVSVETKTYIDLQQQSDGGFPTGRYHYWKSRYVSELSEDAVDTLFHFVAERPSPTCFVGTQQTHGFAARVDPTATAFSHRRHQNEILILPQWADPAETDRHVAWARALFDAMEPFSIRGVYVNSLGNEGEDRIREAYGPNYDRLAAIKASYDPTNVFRSNQNIRPKA